MSIVMNLSTDPKSKLTPGKLFRDAIHQERPLQIVGTVNALCALLAERSGFRALYLSGAGVANASFGQPDLGRTTLEDVRYDAARICNCTDLPLLVDIDTGWNNPQVAVEEMERVGVAGVQIEDQVEAKRCGHRPSKQLVSPREMEVRIQQAVAGRTDPHFFIMARTDATESEGLRAAIDRCLLYVAAGADMIFAEAFTSLADYQTLANELNVPLLANITEFGRTPLFHTEELAKAGVEMVLYPLSAFRAMNAAAREVYMTIRREGTQRRVVNKMQTREELYELLDYYASEEEQGKQDGRNKF